MRLERSVVQTGFFLTVLAVLTLSFGVGSARKEVAGAKAPGPRKYVGVKACKLCHSAKKRGNQYKVWSESAHARAYQDLAGEKALEKAQELGIEDPQKSGKCLRCHVTAYGVARKLVGVRFSMKDGVQCESCHGPGSAYKKLSVMKNPEMAVKNGLILPDEKKCLGCHNEENPFHKPFEFEEEFRKIAHPIPKTP